jgi:ferredoxin
MEGGHRVPRAVILNSKCQGHGLCAGLVPDVFEVDESGMGHVAVDTISDEDSADVHEAVLSCPENAIQLID